MRRPDDRRPSFGIPSARASHLRAVFLLGYYRWLVKRGFPLHGNDPVTGRKREYFRPADREEGRVAYLALARLWARRAREARRSADICYALP